MYGRGFRDQLWLFSVLSALPRFIHRIVYRAGAKDRGDMSTVKAAIWEPLETKAVGERSAEGWG